MAVRPSCDTKLTGLGPAFRPCVRAGLHPRQPMLTLQIACLPRLSGDIEPEYQIGLGSVHHLSLRCLVLAMLQLGKLIVY